MKKKIQSVLESPIIEQSLRLYIGNIYTYIYIWYIVELHNLHITHYCKKKQHVEHILPGNSESQKLKSYLHSTFILEQVWSQKKL